MSVAQSEGCFTQKYLEDNVVAAYWVHQAAVEHFQTSSSTVSVNLAKEWENYLNNSGVLTPSDHTFLSERLLLRELLWMLRGAKESFAFSWDGTEYALNENVQLRHATQVSLKNVVNEMCPYGGMSVRLRDFVFSVAHACTPQHRTTQTSQAFASSVALQLAYFDQKLSNLERVLIRQEKTLTLLMFIEEIEPHLQRLAHMYDILEQAVLNSQAKSPAQQVTKLLGCLELAMENASGVAQVHLLHLILKLYLDTIRPYIDFVDNFISSGILEDPYGEFVIKRAQDITFDDSRYWKESLYVSELGSCGGSEILGSLLDAIISAGKSMEHLKLAGLVSNYKLIAPQGTLYHDILNELQKEAKLEQASDNLVQVPRWESGHPGAIFGDVNRWLETTKFSGLVTLDRLSESRAPCISFNCTFSTVQRTVQQLVRESCAVNSAKFLDFLMLQSKLSEHIGTVHDYFLMFAGDIMHSFTTEVFSKLLSGASEARLNAPFLNFALQETMLWHDSPMAKNLSIQLRECTSKLWLDSFDAVVLKYEVAWPVTIVLTSASLNTYNQVFTFLCKVKCAKFILEELRFQPLEQNAQGLPTIFKQHAHSLHLLRFQVFSFLKGLHDCLMQDALYDSKLVFDRDLRNATNLGAVIECHEKFVARLSQQCLLGQQFSEIQKIILALLKLCVNLQVLWNKGVRNIAPSQIGTIQQSFLMFHAKFKHQAKVYADRRHREPSKVLAFAANLQHLQFVQV